jgi:NhaA family Na+:H+ antiporter
MSKSRLLNTIRRFLRLEASGGMVLLIVALAALVLSNSPLSVFYQKLFQTSSWMNELLMTVFFLLMGLELKRGILIGELSSIAKMALPGVAALGGMLVPALIYSVLNQHSVIGLKGWAVPVATDIAFALGILSLFNHRVPLGLRLFLMALAIFDDIGAIIIIAVFHTHTLSWVWGLLTCATLLILGCLNRIGVYRLVPYLLLGGVLWVCLLKSGVHVTIAGVLLAFMIPLRQQQDKHLSPLKKLEETLHPWVVYCVMPFFAFANAGVSLQGLSLNMLMDSVTLGIVAGLFLGKQIGVFGFTWLMVKFKWAVLPVHSSWQQLYGVAVLCGIGFTMSLFIGSLAFENDASFYLVKVRLGVLLASVLSGLLGAIVLAKQ